MNWIETAAKVARGISSASNAYSGFISASCFIEHNNCIQQCPGKERIAMKKLAANLTCFFTISFWANATL